ncbi:MAG: LacI family transcriptional regulator [Bacteroidia bacterium]|nr:LacI family transcriptional regulator [Bacteroidia bacterium]
MKRTTIKDLAKALNLNISTISRALSDHPNVSEATKAKVRALAKELKYKPNFLAKNFRNRESRLIALIVPQLNMFFIPSVIRGVSDVFDAKGYNLLLLNSRDSISTEIQNIKKCEAYSVDGILISVTSQTTNLDHIQDLLETNLPIVQLDRVISSSKISTVTINDELAALKGTQLLLDQGITNLYGFFGHEALKISQLRKKGFVNALKAAGLSSEGRIVFADRKEEASEELVNNILPRAQFPIGVFCNSDEMLIEVYRTLNKKDIQIPDQVSLSCISDGITPNMLKINIPFIEHSGYSVGEEAARLLLDQLKSQGGDVQPKHSTVRTRVVA